ncbi:MAG: DUF4907 domain-containing protein [Bacteroidota bacterium]
MKQFNCILSISFVLLFCTIHAKAQTGIMYPKHEYTYATFQNSDRTYGYTILDNGKKYIHQPTIPARTGNKGFSTKQDAEKVATLMINKIKKGMTPNVTVEELKRLNIR